MRNSIQKVLMISLSIFSALQSTVAPWTWCYKKKFTNTIMRNSDTAFEKTGLPPFTQLIFSWNAHMPSSKIRSSGGGFRFFVRVRYVDTHDWSGWHRMAEWGKLGGTTFYAQHEDGLEYCYVRLEMPKGRYADAFQIKVESLHGAPLGLIKMLAVCSSNLSSFETEDPEVYDQLSYVYLKGVPALSQRELDHPQTPKICSPTSLCVLASYLADHQFDPVTFADGVFDKGLKVYGSWSCNTAYAFHATDGAAFFHVQRLHNFKTLYDYLRKGIPVVVSVRGSLTGAPKAYPGGHLLTVVGFDPERKLVLCHDPAVWKAEDVFKEYRLDEFLIAWENSHRLAYIGEPT